MTESLWILSHDWVLPETLKLVIAALHLVLGVKKVELEIKVGYPSVSIM